MANKPWKNRKLQKKTTVMLLIFTLILFHWYASLFFQSIFHHRYAAHGHFTMSRFWERAFYIGCFLTQGSSYINARVYGIMHRMHHAHTDTPEDPHSPGNTPNLFTMMWQTRQNYQKVLCENIEIGDGYRQNLPDWPAFDRIAQHLITRLLWIGVYTLIYALIVTQWWMWFFLPIHVFMGAFQGAAVNWWAHRYGYRNFTVDNTSRNILPVDLIFWGESYHNNHHRNPNTPNNAVKWFEWDAGYWAMRMLDTLGIIKLKTKPV